MKDKEILENELLSLTNRVKGQLVYRGNPAASGLPAYTKTIQHGRQYVMTVITKEEFDAAARDPENESYAIPPLSPELQALSAFNIACWMPEADWTSLTDAVLEKEPVPEGVDERTFEYMAALSRRELHGFISEVDEAREAYENRANGTVSITQSVTDSTESNTFPNDSNAEVTEKTSSNDLLASKKARDEEIARAVWEHDHLPNW